MGSWGEGEGLVAMTGERCCRVSILYVGTGGRGWEGRMRMLDVCILVQILRGGLLFAFDLIREAD